MQKDIFMQSEADAWLNRNRDIIGKHDPVSELIEQQGIRPTCILEVGCADGWRLAKLREKYGAQVCGVEPSMQACMEGAVRRIPMHQMTASCLPVVDGGFDMVIYGYCLYLADPKDWLLIASEGDRALVDGGHIIIHDFAETLQPFARKYEHRAGLMAYHVDFSKLWLAHPLYSLVTRKWCGDDEMVTVLKKLPADAIEVLP